MPTAPSVVHLVLPTSACWHQKDAIFTFAQRKNGKNTRKGAKSTEGSRVPTESALRGGEKHRWSCAAGVFFVIPASPRFNLPHTWIWWMIIGRFANSTMGLGTVSVSGRRRVPKPPTRMRARTMFLFEGDWGGEEESEGEAGGMLRESVGAPSGRQRGLKGDERGEL